MYTSQAAYMIVKQTPVYYSDYIFDSGINPLYVLDSWNKTLYILDSRVNPLYVLVSVNKALYSTYLIVGTKLCILVRPHTGIR